MTSVFDVAAELLERGGGTMETVKLQKLCFYAFGWYARLTAEPLFGEKFYAMQYGPVVGELLSAHAKLKRIDQTAISVQRDVRGDDSAELDSYKSAVIDAVWLAYGRESSWDLVERTHDEQVWIDAWESRHEGALRGDLYQSALIEYFLDRPLEAGEKVMLPPAMVSRAPFAELSTIEKDAKVHASFVDSVRTFTFAR
ncbi:Panacea domain-containing protein [Microbacterium maritypicum]|uniref:Antitoxin SocA-like Panacea domain-containing protein n=1 Tax=Microbacterium maritypicum MF109 TaxID=1333857 RepID=T5KU64_MICMQ|nr:type II toxin-antitoxin system antitoxin SocA domain-containing protein [Microbacterium liquefaciens]EQM81875.1 hypothetical protein L687_00520 [Microbacterium maritypicum MF109]